MKLRTRPATGLITLPGFEAALGAPQATITNEDAIRLIVHEHPEDFPSGLAEFGLTPKYAWEYDR